MSAIKYEAELPSEPHRKRSMWLLVPSLMFIIGASVLIAYSPHIRLIASNHATGKTPSAAALEFAATGSCHYPAELEGELNQAWAEFKPVLAARLHENLNHDTPVSTQRNVLALYRTFYELISFVRKTGACTDASNRNRDFQNLDELASVLAIPFEARYLTRAVDATGQAYTGWICDAPFGPGDNHTNPVASPQRNVKGPQEVMLNSANYLYLVCATLHAIGNITAAERTPAMHQLMEQTPFIVQTYSRWLDDSSNLLEINRRAQPGHPRHRHGGVTWGLESAVSPAVAGGIAELMQVNGIDGITESMRELAQIWAELLRDYAQPLGSGRYTFDASKGDDVVYNLTAGYTGATPPELKASQYHPVNDLAYDISHFRIWLIVLETYGAYNERWPTSGFDPEAILRGLARQFHEKVWNGDLQQPQFANYFSGSVMNGWYAAKFDAQGRYVAGSGTPPFGLTAVAPWYFRLGLWDPAISEIQSAYYDAQKGFATLTAEERLRYLSNFVAE